MKRHVKPLKIDLSQYPEGLLNGIGDFCGTILSVSNSLESAMRQFHPPQIPGIQKALQPFASRLKLSRKQFEGRAAGNNGNDVTDQLLKAGEAAERSLDYIMGADHPQAAIGQMMKAMRQHYRAQEHLYPLILGLKPVGRYFLEPGVRDRLEDFNSVSADEAQTGLFLDQGEDLGGGYCLYVPESYDGQTDWPLVVALHGGSGRGRDFIWLWMREARSRRFLLLAPNSADRTWSFEDRTDGDAILRMIDAISERWCVDASRMLLTGMSDGAIYTLICGLLPDAPFSALAPVSGVLHPVDLSYTSGKRIYMVHGTLDWMFSVHHAHQAFARLKGAGAEIQFQEISNLSHTYPREENPSILTWFDDSLSLNRQR